MFKCLKLKNKNKTALGNVFYLNKGLKCSIKTCRNAGEEGLYFKKSAINLRQSNVKNK